MGIKEQRLTVEEALLEINKIKDIDVKNLIFMEEYSGRKFLKIGSKMYIYFNNILILSFMFLYGKYLHWRKTKIQELEENRLLKNSSNFMRILTSFEKLYYEFNLTYEFIENALNDIQILLNSDNSAVIMREFEITGGFKFSPYFSELIHQAKIGRYSARSQVQDLGYLRFLLVQFLDMLPFIIHIDVMKNDVPLRFIKDETCIEGFQRLKVSDGNVATVDIDVNYSFLNDNDGVYYFLESVTQKKVHASREEYLILNYTQIGDFNNGNCVYVLVREKGSSILEEEIEEAFILELEEGINAFKNELFPGYVKNVYSTDHFIKDFNTINFRYIRILALAISDILDSSAKRLIYEEYSEKLDYATMFVKNEVTDYNFLNDNSFVESGYAWDTVIATLLIQESATRLLTKLFEKNPDTYFVNLTKNLKYRFGNKFESLILEYNASSKIKEEIKSVKNKVYGNKNTNKKVVNEGSICARIQALAIVSTLSELTYANKNTTVEIRYPLSIISRIRIADEIKNEINKSIVSYEVGKDALLVLVDQTLKTLYCFYYALFAYAKEKFNFEKESILNQLTLDQVEQSQTRANNSFNRVMSEKSLEMQALPKEEIKTLLKKFKEFCRECAYPGKQGSYNELLKCMLGRDFLLTYNNISCFEDCFDEPITTRMEFYNLVDTVKEALEYLKTGKSRGSRHSEGIIYPYVAFLDYTSKNSDGYVVNHFSVFTDESIENDFKVISEYSYSPNQGYYCVPNRFRSNDEIKLWIEPIMINCKHMDYDMQKPIEDEDK